MARPARALSGKKEGEGDGPEPKPFDVDTFPERQRGKSLQF